MRTCENCDNEVLYPCDTLCLGCKSPKLKENHDLPKPIELKQMVWLGKVYFVDERLGQLRNVEDHSDYIDSWELVEMAVEAHKRGMDAMDSIMRDRIF